MSQSEEPPGLKVLRSRVYFDPSTGQIVHLHSVVSAEDLDDARVEDELAAFEESLERRHEQPLDSIDVDDSLLQEAMAPDVTLSVDVGTRELVRDA